MEIKEVNYEFCTELNIIKNVKFEVIIEKIVMEEAILKVCIGEIVLKEAQLEDKEATNVDEDGISSDVETESTKENLIEAEIEKHIPRDAVHDNRLESLETKFPEKNREYNESRSDKGIPRRNSLLRKTEFEKIENKECRIETSADIDHQADSLRNKNEILPVMITKDKRKSPKKETNERKSKINEPIRTLVNISRIDTSEVCSPEKFQVCIPERIPTVKLNPTDLNDIQNCTNVCKNVATHSYIEEDISVAVTKEYSSSKLQKEFTRCRLQATEQNRNVVKVAIAIGIFTVLAILFSTLVVVRTEDTV